MTDEQGINIPLTTEPVFADAGDNTIVWVPDQSYLNLNSSEDEKYTINISNFSIVPFANVPPILVPLYSYEVIIMTEMNGSNLVHPPNCPDLSVWDDDSSSCINQSTSTIEHYQNKRVLKIINMLGQPINEKKNTPLFHIYDDGSIEKKYILE